MDEAIQRHQWYMQEQALHVVAGYQSVHRQANRTTEASRMNHRPRTETPAAYGTTPGSAPFTPVNAKMER